MERRFRVLVIEDEAGMREFLRDVLEGEGYDVEEAEDGDKGLSMVKERGYDLVITDLRMPGLAGISLVKAIREVEDPPELVVLTAYGTVSQAVEAMKAGALDFMEKPLSGPDQVRLVAKKALEKRALIVENERLRRTVLHPKEVFVFADPAMKALLRQLEKAARTDVTILIEGESGTGKEVLAREIHRMRFSNVDAPFVAVNCAAIPETLLESEIFGHERGAFTGAISRKVGLVEAASSGTLFLDEIGEMPMALQSKLLRVLETREFQRVGGTRTLYTNARFVAATNRDLEGLVKAGKFREDLYYRVAVFKVRVPPLRERPKDIEALARVFLEKFGRGLGLGLSEDALEALLAYKWPGNVRELRNTIERAVIVAEGEVITREDLGLPIETEALPKSEGLLAARERETILEVLREVSYNRRLAAKKLGISLRTLRYRLREYGITEKARQ